MTSRTVPPMADDTVLTSLDYLVASSAGEAAATGGIGPTALLKAG
jgi:hypothetical protein